jgi:hypothetical protein
MTLTSVPSDPPDAGAGGCLLRKGDRYWARVGRTQAGFAATCGKIEAAQGTDC